MAADWRSCVSGGWDHLQCRGLCGWDGCCCRCPGGRGERHDGGRSSGSSEFAEEVETLLCFLGQCCSVVGPGEVLCDVYTQELGAAHSLHGRTIDGQRSMQRVHSPEVNNNLLRLLHIQREIVVTAPPGQAAHLAPVVCLISVADETHHSRVIRKFNEEVGVVWRCAVMGQQSEEEGAQHTSLGSPCVQCDGAGCVTATRTAWGLPVRKSNSPLHSDVLSPSWTNLWMSCWGMIVLNAELKSMNSNLTYVSCDYDWSTEERVGKLSHFICRILTLLKHKNTIICLQIFKKHAKLTYLFIWKTMLQSVILLWKCTFRPGMSVFVKVCETRPLPVYPIVFRHPGLPVGGKHSVFNFIHRHVSSFLLVSLIWQPVCVSSLRRRGWLKKCLQYFEFGLQYLVQGQSYIQHL